MHFIVDFFLMYVCSGHYPIKGKVVDANNESLIEVTIQVSGTATGTVTDAADN